MWNDPIVEEVHAIREQLLAQFGGDLHKFCEYARAQSSKPVGADARSLLAPDQRVDPAMPNERRD